MPKRTYRPDEKRLVRRLLLLHGGNVPLVHQLTGYPKRTIHNWREQWDDDYELYTDALAQNLFDRANAKAAAQSLAIPGTTEDTASAQPEDSFAQYAQLRNKLMEHANTLANNLLLGDGFVNQRVHALSRLLDRVLDLDEILPKHEPEKTIRFEHYYDGGIQENAPWVGADSEEGVQRDIDRYAARVRKHWESWKRQKAGIYDDPSDESDIIA